MVQSGSASFQPLPCYHSLYASLRKLIQVTTNLFQIRDAKDTNQQVRYKFYRKKRMGSPSNIWHFSTQPPFNCSFLVDKAAVGKSVEDGVDRGSMDSMGENRGVVENWVGTSVPGVGNSVDGVDRDSGVDGLNRVGDLSNISSVQ